MAKEKTSPFSRIAPGVKGPRHPAWRGGRSRDARGRMMIHRPDHPRAQRNGYVSESILIMEEVLGRPLAKDERVYHKDNVTSNNDPDNLTIGRRSPRLEKIIAALASGPKTKSELCALCAINPQSFHYGSSYLLEKGLIVRHAMGVYGLPGSVYTPDPNRFRQGGLAQENPLVLCGCGCGSTMPQFGTQGRRKKYLYGHKLKKTS